ncbi:complex I subunit 1/NuoH family protein [Planctellipticum variicoloris]|uniref:complex I subunit 1/NuoH family protein n=1 Tax=Planctellipticum variicoloris TaxID=3064265 RepID=UPI0030134F0E|nr:NADH-quinone oxidoreductase subunit H [Planctomycetaceae bacterium SH412]
MPRPLIAMSLQEFFSNLEIPLLNAPLGELGGFLLAAFFHAFLLFNLFGAMPMFFIWLERKVSGRIQDRLGPTRVGGMFGWLQSIADPIKLMQKEDLIPDAADRWLFKMAPFLAVLASFGAFMVLPFADGWYAVAADTGVFLILAILSLEVFGIILAGYSSGSKWALFGAMREAAQMVSYEIPMALCALVPLVAAGTLDFREIARLQEAGLHQWLIFTNPFTFAAFFVYFTTATASVKRAPFDLAEAESELVAGFHTEYSGIRWSFFFLAEYASMFAVSGIAVLLFLGGSATGLGLEPLLINPLRSWGQDFLVQGFSLGNYVANLIGATIFVVKAGVLVTVQIWVRWTLPRLRIDQVMTTCLKYLVPISCFLFLGAVLWPLLLASSTLARPTFLPVGRTDAATKAKTAAVPNSDFEIRISNFPPVEEGRR